MKTLTYNDKHFTIKSDWSELTGKQFLQVSYIRGKMMNPNDTTELQAMRITLFTVLCDLPFYLQQYIGAGQWADILTHIDWVFQTPGLKTNPIPKIRYRLTKLYGPIDLMNTSSFGEFMEADNAFLSFMNDQKPESAWLLLTILWRPKRKDLSTFKKDPNEWNGDIREPFNSSHSRERMIKISKRLPVHFAVAAVLYYWAVREIKLIKNQMLRPLFTGSKNTAPSKLGWLDTLLAMSNKQFGTLDQTQKQDWLLVLVTLAQDIECAEKAIPKK